MAKAPPIPKEQRASRGGKPDIEGAARDRRDEKTGLQSSQPGDDDVNLEEQGRFANIKQNTTRRRNQQDR